MERKIKEKFNCVYCGKSTSTFCGYWKLISVGSYIGNRKKDKTTYIHSCYAHIGCYIHKHRRLIECGIIPLVTNCAEYNRPKQIVEMMKLHNIKPLKLKNTIKFWEKVIKEYGTK